MTSIVAVDGLAGLIRNVRAGKHEYAILLNFGAYSRKTIRRNGQRWLIENHIDDTSQVLTDEELWTESNIGEALDKNALVEMPD